jgi:hypothetical protein
MSQLSDVGRNSPSMPNLGACFSRLILATCAYSLSFDVVHPIPTTMSITHLPHPSYGLARPMFQCLHACFVWVIFLLSELGKHHCCLHELKLAVFRMISRKILRPTQIIKDHTCAYVYIYRSMIASMGLEMSHMTHTCIFDGPAGMLNSLTDSYEINMQLAMIQVCLFTPISRDVHARHLC